MNNSNNKDVTSGIAGIIAIVLFVVGVAFNQLPIEITRPKGAEMKSLEVKSPQDVDARLWQDPFSAVKNHSESESKGNIFKSLEEIKEREVEKLKKDINDHLSGDKIVTVLGVMVNAGPYAEYAEQRRRMRYAVLAGLANEHYVPEDGEHIGYVRTQKSNKDSLELPEIIPFEWLQGAGQDKRKHKILILWIAEQYFLDKPYQKLASLFNSLKCINCDKDKDNYKFKVLGPFTSIVLSEIAKEIKKEGITVKDIEFYSATTTVSAKFILHSIDESNEYKDEEEAQEKIKDMFNNRLFRTMHSDSELAKTLIKELERREIEPGNDTILLLSEWDTFYGRYLPKTIERIIKKNKYPHDSEEEVEKKLKEILPRYTYLRGLDGDIPASKNEEGKQDKQKNQTAADQQLSKERPEGTSQLDYIERLADKIATEIEDNNLKSTLIGKLLFGDESKDSKVKAIGLLGSDADDKLILLQALRPRLPGMVFFTTDMDARLIPHGSHDWGHNLIVASSFGLNLNGDFQQGIPPFRDVYQTSTFLATQLAVCDIDLKAKHELLDKWLKEEPPRLFEIGRTKEFNITPKNPTPEKNETNIKAEQTGSEKVCSLIKTSSALNPPVPLLFPSEKVIQIFIFTIMLILILIMISVNLKNNPWDTIKSMVGLCEVSLIIFFLVFSIILGCIIKTNIDEIYEPFLWFEGISIWPTQIIRFLTVILSLCFFGYLCIIIKKDQDDLGKNFFNYGKESTFLENSKMGTNIFYFKKLKEKNLPAKMLFNRYLHKSKFDYRLTRTFIFLLLFLGFGYLLFHELFPVPDPPTRGQATFIINRVLLWASILPFWFLLFFITDAFRCSERFLHDMTYYTTEWPSGLINRYMRQWNIVNIKLKANKQLGEPNKKYPIFTDNELVNDWLEVEVAAIHTESISKLIRYPFIILILLIFSINHFFDNWAFPWSIAIVITFAFITLIFHAWKLQRAAEKLRDSALDHLYKKLIRAKGDKNSGAIANQIELLIEQTNNLKRGAFQSFLQRPLLKSILALLGSVGISQLLQYFYR